MYTSGSSYFGLVLVLGIRLYLSLYTYDGPAKSNNITHGLDQGTAVR